MQDAAKLQYLIGPATKRDGTWRLSLSDLFVLRGTELKRERYNRQASLSSSLACKSLLESGFLGRASSIATDQAFRTCQMQFPPCE